MNKFKCGKCGAIRYEVDNVVAVKCMECDSLEHYGPFKEEKDDGSKVPCSAGLSDAPDNGAIAMATSCCGYIPELSETYPVYWNPYNRVVQCHNCGTVWKPEGR